MILFRDRATTVLFEVLSTLDKNSKFLLPLNICPIVPETFLKADIKFDFIDINLNTLCMDEVLALEAIKNDSSISGILFVKTFGIDLESFRHQIENGIDTSSRALPISLHLEGSAATVASDLFMYVLYDTIFYINMDGSVSVSS